VALRSVSNISRCVQYLAKNSANNKKPGFASWRWQRTALFIWHRSGKQKLEN